MIYLSIIQLYRLDIKICVKKTRNVLLKEKCCVSCVQQTVVCSFELVSSPDVHEKRNTLFQSVYRKCLMYITAAICTFKVVCLVVQYCTRLTIHLVMVFGPNFDRPHKLVIIFGLCYKIHVCNTETTSSIRNLSTLQVTNSKTLKLTVIEQVVVNFHCCTSVDTYFTLLSNILDGDWRFIQSRLSSRINSRSNI